MYGGAKEKCFVLLLYCIHRRMQAQQRLLRARKNTFSDSGWSHACGGKGCQTTGNLLSHGRDECCISPILTGHFDGGLLAMVSTRGWRRKTGLGASHHRVGDARMSGSECRADDGGDGREREHSRPSCFWRQLHRMTNARSVTSSG
jgi:hypothetical protein